MKYLIATLAVVATALTPLRAVAESGASGNSTGTVVVLPNKLDQLRGMVMPIEVPDIPANLIQGLRQTITHVDEFRGGLGNNPADRYRIEQQTRNLPPIVWNHSNKGNQFIDPIVTGSAIIRFNPSAVKFQIYPDDKDSSEPHHGNLNGLYERFEELEKFTGELVAQFLPRPITNLKILAGKYTVDIPVNHQ